MIVLKVLNTKICRKTLKSIKTLKAMIDLSDFSIIIASIGKHGLIVSDFSGLNFHAPKPWN
jgi:hypothetical protein